MKLLLFDQNISPRLVERLADIYPDSTHVSLLGMGNAMDIEIWQYAHDNDYMIVTKDADFSELGVVRGFPPKIIWIRRGNCSTMRLKPSCVKTVKPFRHLAKMKRPVFWFCFRRL